MSSDDADLHCPGGGKFYACTSGSLFVGCCKSDPCGSSSCSDNDLTPASFNASYVGSFPNQHCAGGDFYTCEEITPTFLGCCKSNPCQQNGCPNNDLTAANLLNAGQASAFPTSTTSSSSSSTSSSAAASTSTSSGSSTSASASASPSATNTPLPSTDQVLSRGAIAGIAVGGFIVFLAILAVVVACCTRRDKRTPPPEKQSFVVVRDNDPDEHFYSARNNQIELEAPAIQLDESPRVYHPPSSSLPLNTASIISTPSTTIAGSSPAISPFAVSPETSFNKWHSPNDVSATGPRRSEVSAQDTRSELYGSDVINVGYQSRTSLLSPAASPYSDGQRYQAYRPPTYSSS